MSQQDFSQQFPNENNFSQQFSNVNNFPQQFLVNTEDEPVNTPPTYIFPVFPNEDEPVEEQQDNL